MFSLFLALCRCDDPVDCSAYNSSCMLCMQHKDECFFCFEEDTQQSRCIKLEAYNETSTCTHKSREEDKQCVETLGGDAVDTTRYVIGSVVLVLAIVTDLVVRFCSRNSAKDDYAHL